MLVGHIFNCVVASDNVATTTSGPQNFSIVPRSRIVRDMAAGGGGQKKNIFLDFRIVHQLGDERIWCGGRTRDLLRVFGCRSAR